MNSVGVSEGSASGGTFKGDDTKGGEKNLDFPLDVNAELCLERLPTISYLHCAINLHYKHGLMLFDLAFKLSCN